MIDLTLTTDEADRLAADGAVTLYRPGVCVHPPHDHPPDHFDPAGCNRPPAEFAEAAEPCETCDGTPGRLAAMPRIGSAVSWSDCPDCDHGKRRIAAVTHCKGKCNSSGVVSDWEGSAIECPQCDGYGHVPVATVVVEWGPLEVQDDPGQYALHIRSEQSPGPKADDPRVRAT